MRTFVVVAALAGAVGCAKTEEHPVAEPAPAKATVQVPLGGNGDEPPHVAFRITKVYEAQKPIDVAPGHAAGGAWQFFDAVTSDGAPFTFGFLAPPAKGELPMSFGDGVLVTADGARFVSSLARGFAQPAPAAANTRKPLKLRLVVLGRGLSRQPGGGYGEGGTATATKLFFASGATDAEVFFNFDVARRSGEFSEKDAEYDKDLVAIAAKTL